LTVLVDAVAVFCGERIVILILRWESVSTIISTIGNTLRLLGQIILVIIVLDNTLFGSLAVMDRCLDLWLHKGHSSDNSLDLNELVDKICLETARRNVILSEVALETHIVSLYLLRELRVTGGSTCLLGVLLGILPLNQFDCVIEVVLKHLDSLDWVLCDVLTQFWSEGSNLVDADGESLTFVQHVPDPFLDLLETHEFTSGLPHLMLVGVLRGVTHILVGRRVDLLVHKDFE
jgi:hypothetical protein